jgi:UDP-2,4-diacetamido-2,4,6-trideoxy-beta-L-altropyranose hydrolase
MREVVIRADGNTQIGLGHLVRCMALAHMLKDDFAIIFVSFSFPEQLAYECEQYGFSIRIIRNENEFIKEITQKSIVVLDGYSFNSDYQKGIKTIGALLICIDDLHEEAFFADLIINQAPNTNSGQYKALAHTLFALGLEYALLRPQFLAAAKGEKASKKKETAFICFGGSDNLNLTERALRNVLKFTEFKKVLVVTGASWQQQDSLLQLVSSDMRVEYFQALTEAQMIEQLKRADVAIVPASGILNEVLALGVRPIAGMYVPNQKYAYENQKATGSILDAGSFADKEIESALQRFLKEDSVHTNIIDGNSGDRIKALFNQLVRCTELQCKRANENDATLTFQWATNKIVRAFSFSGAEIGWDEHVNWFSKKVTSANCFYYIVSHRERVLGSVRFDAQEDKMVISYLIDPEFHGQGYGLIVLVSAIQHMMRTEKVPNNFILQGYVMKENVQSIKIFKRLGFDQVDLGDRFEYNKIVNA